MRVAVDFTRVAATTKVDIVVGLVQQAASDLDLDVATVEALDGPIAMLLEHVETGPGIDGVTVSVDGDTLLIDVSACSRTRPLDAVAAEVAESFFHVVDLPTGLRMELAR